MKRSIALSIFFLTGCSSLHPALTPDDLSPSTSPGTPWAVPVAQKSNAMPTPPSIALPDGYQPGMAVTLPQVLDFALANNTTTRIAWLQARAADAALGSARAAYLPEVDLDAGVNVGRQSSSGLNATTITSAGPSLSLTYLLFDFGGREAQVDQARQSLIAANFNHNASIRDVVLRTEQAYYDYLDSRALLHAQAATLKERKTSLDAADARHNAGVATIADVLQAKTALSQAQLTYETIEGNVHTIEGALASVMGLPPTTTFDFGELPLEVPAARAKDSIDRLLTDAQKQRPELASARAQAERTRARVREVRAQGLPSIGLTASLGHTDFLSSGNTNSFNPYAAGIAMRFPLFTGWRNTFDVREAEAEVEIADTQVTSLQQQIDLQVWTSYYALQTAQLRLTTSRDLLASATQSADVATNRYQAGVGTIIDVLTAESALETARAQEVQARADWFLSVAQLAHDTGSMAAAEGTTR